ncbi:hypothetical protein LTS10_007083 [Elasticomyces elasticus]|nr:hypothetical protein LTS10_007083 [Elasticomyces elasticus]
MERKRFALTPEQYARAIISLSRRYSSTSAFPGNNYVDIGEWLLQDRSLLNPATPDTDAALFTSASKQPHDLVIVYNSGEKKWDIQQYGQEQHEAFSAASSIPEGGAGQLVFIRGFISPAWVSVLGSKYLIDPEFFRRHMVYLSGSIERHAYSSPSLASCSNNIHRLCVSTVLHRDDFGGQDLHSQRSSHSAELGAYKTQQLGTSKVCCGDSVVREYSTLCASFSVVEQWISLCVSRTEKGWAVVVWMDQGRPLDMSPPGPWTKHIASKATPLPILQHHHKMAFRTTTNRLSPDNNAMAEVQQSAAVLPLQYDSLIALVDLARRAPQDPFSMCIPLFTHAAFSEVQFLNLVDTKIQAQTNAIVEGASANDALANFQYFSTILNRHAHQLKDSIRALGRLSERSIQSTNGAKADSPMRGAVSPGAGANTRRLPSETDIRTPAFATSDGAFTGKGVLEDYEQLHIRCVDLSETCARGISLAMNKATIDESRKAIEQSQRVKRLTMLATFFIPVSFCSSLFGMNVDVLGQGTALRRRWTKLTRTCRGIRREATAGAGEKDPSRLV